MALSMDPVRFYPISRLDFIPREVYKPTLHGFFLQLHLFSRSANKPSFHYYFFFPFSWFQNEI